MTGSEKRSTSRDRFCDRQRVDVLDAGLISQPRQERVERTLLRAGIRHAQDVGARVGPSRHDGGSPLSEDRKSTRLNSSHSQMSYAVFCFKKKTIYVMRVSIMASKLIAER